MSLCQVKALYSYTTSDKQCLSFKKGDMIEVQTQLESGWWEGRCGTKQGWFPSNYVEVIKEDADEEQEPPMDTTLTRDPPHRLSLGTEDLSINEPDQSDWILQKTEDGSAVYYFNVVTKEMRQTRPAEYIMSPDEQSPLEPTFEPSFYSDEDPSSCIMYSADHRDRQSLLEAEALEIASTRPPSMLKPNMTPTKRDSAIMVGARTLDDSDQVTQDQEKLQAVYEANPTDESETTLNACPPADDELDYPPSTWEGHRASILDAIDQLKTLAAQDTEIIQQEAARVVELIRMLLCVSDTMDKESSEHIRNDEQLRICHRALLAAVAKMVLSAKVASGEWAPASSLPKLFNDADEVIHALDRFMGVAQEMVPELREYSPRMMSQSTSPFPWRSSNGSSGKPDPVTALLVLADNVRGAKASFMESLKSSRPVSTSNLSSISSMKSIAPLLVAQFRNLSNTTSQFLSAVEDLCTLCPAHAPSLNKAKQTVYCAMGTLFVVTQSVTNQNLGTDRSKDASLQELASCMTDIEQGVTDICNISHAASADVADAFPSDDNQQVLDSLFDSSDSSVSMTHKSAPKAGSESHGRAQADKLAKFFGEDSIARKRNTIAGEPGTPIPGTPSPLLNRLQSFLGPDYTADEIVFNMEGQVKGGTVLGLVQRLTQHVQFDPKFFTSFLLTYRSFCTSEELFQLLFERYTLDPPSDLTPEELELWKEKKLKLIRLRVFNVLKSWLETYYNEEEGRILLPRLLDFTEVVIRPSMQFGAEQLIKLVKKRMTADNNTQIRKMTLCVRSEVMPTPILPRNIRRLDLLSIEPVELARQMTIMDSTLYSRIKPVECLDKNWGKNDADNIAVNVKTSIEYSNQVTSWVTDSILSKSDPKKRAKILKYWVSVAEKCRSLNNFNTCMAILSAFDNSAIGRLNRTWTNVGAVSMQTLSKIRRLMGANRNFNEYRDIIHKVNPPCIPFLGIYLQDLTFIEDGNSNFLAKSSHLVNFSKRMKTAEVIRELQQHQSAPYLLQAVPDIQEYIKTHLQSSRDEETLYDLSLTIEPREREEDKMARKLKESGF